MTTLFNFIPGSSSFRAPGRFVEYASGGQFVSLTKTLVAAPRSAAGLVAWLADTPILCTTLSEAATYAGVGSPLYEAYRVARMNDPSGEIWISAPEVSGTPAQFTIALSGLPATAGNYSYEIAGRRLTGTTAAGEAVATTAANIAAAINAYVDPQTQAYLPVTATSALGVITLTARTAGTFHNALDIYTDPLDATNIFGVAGRFTVVNSVPGTGTVSMSATLAALGDQIFGLVIAPFGDTANVNFAKAAFNNVNGRWSFDTLLYGIYATIVTGNTVTQTTAGLAPNSEHVSYVGRVTTPTPEYEFCAGYFARQATWLYDEVSGNASRNQSDFVIQGVRAPRDRSTWPSRRTTRNSLINAGVSTWVVNVAGEVCVDKCVTTRRQNGAGQPDIEFSAIQRMFQVMHLFRLWLAEMSFRSANKALAATNPDNLPALYTPADGKSDHIAILYKARSGGLIENVEASARLVVCEVDAGNPSRLNFNSTVDGVDPLDQLAAAITFRRL